MARPIQFVDPRRMSPWQIWLNRMLVLGGMLLVLMALMAPSSPAANALGVYTCQVCGKSPLVGVVWTNRLGAFCGECAKLENRCSICGIPVRTNATKTPDGRYICPRGVSLVVLGADEARKLFETTRQDIIDLLGRNYELRFPAVTVSLFDVDYWTEKNARRLDSLHKMGFSNSRLGADGRWTHLIVVLSGRLRTDTIACLAHEYTHLWINENCVPTRELDGDTVEALCELTAYKLMCAKGWTEQQEKIAQNPYSRGKIQQLIEIEKDRGLAFAYNWVRTDTSRTLDLDRLAVAPAVSQVIPYVAPSLPDAINLNGIFTGKKRRLAILNGLSFMTNEAKYISLRDKSVEVRCLEIESDSVVITLDASPTRIKLRIAESYKIP